MKIHDLTSLASVYKDRHNGTSHFSNGMNNQQLIEWGLRFSLIDAEEFK